MNRLHGQHFMMPLCGVPPILLGMSQREIREIAGPPDDSRRGEWYFVQGCVHLCFDGDGHVNFIELLRSDAFSCSLFGIDPHRTPADWVVTLIRRYADLDTTDPELGYSYLFPRISLSLWRSVKPDEADQDGRFFEAIGVGVPGYFENLSRIAR